MEDEDERRDKMANLNNTKINGVVEEEGSFEQHGQEQSSKWFWLERGRRPAKCMQKNLVPVVLKICILEFIFSPGRSIQPELNLYSLRPGVKYDLYSGLKATAGTKRCPQMPGCAKSHWVGDFSPSSRLQPGLIVPLLPVLENAGSNPENGGQTEGRFFTWYKHKYL
ncbi:hypothetical protein PVAP13_6KG137612 [Panicum virgatum]|uniref:Uncharacterized protein n=1 Tax=Panicum virgatum TaxID=38727 RepID=A0A8T0REV0_PANVG|nr:hypothetical protein PVAP13_6KG137612 [Panicum virgatum]